MGQLIRNVREREVFDVRNLVDYEPGKVNSMSLSQSPGCKMTVFAIDAGEGLSTHAAGGDAMANILEGEVDITIEDTTYRVVEGQSIVMPKGIPHALDAVTPFKMLLVVVLPVQE